MAGKIEQKTVEDLLLSSATEDYNGLYEAVWELNAKFPDASLGTKYDAANAALAALIERGWLKVEREILTKDYKHLRYERINPSVLDSILANPVSWYPEYDHTRIVFTTTEAGDRAYFGNTASRGTQ